MKLAATLIISVLTNLLLAVQAASEAPSHPLDSLTADEYKAVVQILLDGGRISDTTRFPEIALKPPPKAEVKAWTANDSFTRMATAYIKEGTVSFKAEIDLTDASIVSFEPAAGEGMMLLEEIFGATDLALSSPEMVAGLAVRGIIPEQVYCLPLTAGSYGDPEEAGRRLMKVPCSVLPTGSNWFTQPIEGLLAFVDLNNKEVLEVTDSGALPVPEESWGYAAAEIKQRFGFLRGEAMSRDQEVLAAEAVAGELPYSIENSVVEWDIWRFHYRVDKRPGMILDQVEVNDQGAWRSVMYEAHLSEVFVPYMDPDNSWYWRTYMDSGEYGFGLLLSPLRPGVDCPRTATYKGVTMSDDFGMPFEIPDTICIFERQIGDPAWRHFEIFEQSATNFAPTEGRPSKELVVRSASAVGNYDYLIDYIFMLDGTIKIAVGSTGLDAIKGVASKSMNDETAAEETRFGSLVAEHLLAVNHAHHFSFRLDFDIDGQSNDFKKGKLAPLNMSEYDIPRTSMWGVEYEMIQSELAARTKINPAVPSNYYFVNTNVESGLGHNPGYQLIPGGSFAYSLLSVDDPPVARNAYVDNQLYVTPHSPNEIYAGGEYAVQSTGNDTLQTWTDADRNIENQDIVAWYTVGFHHVPRMEDWPVMPTHWATFQLRPFNFFTYNPAITVAEPKAATVTPPLGTEEETSSAFVTASQTLWAFASLTAVLLM